MSKKILMDKKPIMFKTKSGSELLWRKEDDKHILLVRHDLYVLNEFSKEVADMCDGMHSISDIVKIVHNNYGVDECKAEEQVNTFLNYLFEKELIYFE